MTYKDAWRKLNSNLKRSLKRYEEEAHASKTKGDEEGFHKWDERANALHTLREWFNILDKELKNTSEDTKRP